MPDDAQEVLVKRRRPLRCGSPTRPQRSRLPITSRRRSGRVAHAAARVPVAVPARRPHRAVRTVRAVTRRPTKQRAAARTHVVRRTAAACSPIAAVRVAAGVAPVRAARGAAAPRPDVVACVTAVVRHALAAPRAALHSSRQRRRHGVVACLLLRRKRPQRPDAAVTGLAAPHHPRAKGLGREGPCRPTAQRGHSSARSGPRDARETLRAAHAHGSARKLIEHAAEEAGQVRRVAAQPHKHRGK